MEAALNQITFLTQAQALLGKAAAISDDTTQRNAEIKSIINKDRQVAPKRMPLGARLAVNTLMSPQEAARRWTRMHS